MTQPFIEIDGLVKSFGPFRAVDGLSFQVNRGDVLGFLGPNGAGKSTTMKMIAGFLTPTEGRVSIQGRDIVEDTIEAQRLIGYLPEGAPAYGEMTPRSYLTFIAEVRGARGEEARRQVEEACERTHLHKVMDQPIETLSKGFKRRVGLAQAILHNPPILIMDEPTDGLDPNQKHAVRELISDMAEEKAIIISTHILEEVEAVCTRALIIDRGRIVADGRPHELAARSSYHNAVTMVLVPEDEDAAIQAVETIDAAGSQEIRRDADGTVHLTLFPRSSDDHLIAAVARALDGADIVPVALHAEQGRLDDVFRSVTTPDARARAAATA